MHGVSLARKTDPGGGGKAETTGPGQGGSFRGALLLPLAAAYQLGPGVHRLYGRHVGILVRYREFLELKPWVYVCRIPSSNRDTSYDIIAGVFFVEILLKQNDATFDRRPCFPACRSTSGPGRLDSSALSCEVFCA